MINKKAQGVLGIVIALVIVVFMLISFLMLLGYMQYKEDVRECKNYNTYGYYTQIVGDWVDVFISGEEVCLIIMEDGTRLPLNDFRTMSIKNAMVR